MVNALSATNAYNNQLKLQNSLEDISGVEENNGKPSFSGMVKDALSDAIDTQYKAEATKMDAVTGKGDITDLVTSIANAEMALNTIVAVRDRAISAYQDIIRMPI